MAAPTISNATLVSDLKELAGAYRDAIAQPETPDDEARALEWAASRLDLASRRLSIMYTRKIIAP